MTPTVIINIGFKLFTFQYFLACVFSATCSPGHTLCDVDNCILDAWICDGTTECADGTDEAECPTLAPAP